MHLGGWDVALGCLPVVKGNSVLGGRVGGGERGWGGGCFGGCYRGEITGESVNQFRHSLVHCL